MKKALILHAWQSKSSNHWYPWLKSELERRGYQVSIPDLPTMDTDLPNMGLQLKSVEDLADKETTVIGHSLGCLLALRLAEEKKYKKMILVAGWDFDDLTAGHRLFWQKKIDHAKIKQNVGKIYCLSSNNDPYITSYQGEEMSKRLGGKFILVKNAGHFTKKEKILTIPQILIHL